MKQCTISMRMALIAVIMAFYGVPVLAQNIVAGTGDIIGQEEVTSIGVFNGQEEWSALGKAPFPLPNGDLPYGLRTNRRGASALWQHDLRDGTQGFKFDSEISFGDVFGPNIAGEVYKEFGPSRFDISYFHQNQFTSPPTLNKIDIVTVTPAFGQNPFLACNNQGFNFPCGGRVGILNTNPSFELDVAGYGRFNNTVITSDARFKQDINTIENGMSVVSNLRGTTYEFRTDGETVSQQHNLPAGVQSGFIAQEVEEILPHLVVTDEEGYKAVNYIGVIPYLVEGMHELSAENKSLLAENTELKDRLAAIEARLENMSSAKGALGSIEMQAAELYQNVPNPFDQATKIGYFLPENAGTAQLLVFDMNGRQIRTYDIAERGEGAVTLNANDLEAGMYFYSLVSDGTEVATKRMILTK